MKGAEARFQGFTTFDLNTARLAANLKSVQHDDTRTSFLASCTPRSGSNEVTLFYRRRLAGSTSKQPCISCGVGRGVT